MVVKQMGVRCHQAIVPGFMVMEKVAGGGDVVEPLSLDSW